MIYGGRRQVFVEWEGQNQPEIELIGATVRSCRIKWYDATVASCRNSIQIARLTTKAEQPRTAKRCERLTDPSEADFKPVTSVLGETLSGATPQ